MTARLDEELLRLRDLEPQPRGYAFERFLNELFDAYGLEARKALRLVGEQIDGSSQLDGETYLLEAKWRDVPVVAAPLHAFRGKVEDKVAWAREPKKIRPRLQETKWGPDVSWCDSRERRPPAMG